MFDPNKIWRGLLPFYLVGLGCVLGLAYGWHFAMTTIAPEVTVDRGGSVAEKSCEISVSGLCFIKPIENGASAIFGFAEFVTALALLIVLYTISDVRFRFRVAVAPFPLLRITFFCLALIGLLTLLTDVWFSEGWLLPEFLAKQSFWQMGLGGIFLSLVLVWVYVGFINPPIFSRHNALRYASVLYHHILKGVDTDLPVIAEELSRSAKNIIRICETVSYKQSNNETEHEENLSVSVIAHDLLLLIGYRRFCRHIVAKAPETAIRFFEAISEQEKYRVPIGQFALNISTEALLNKDSVLYHESDGYSSGYFGYVQPFSKAIYGDIRLISELGSQALSPFDIHYQEWIAWEPDTLEVYSRLLLIAFEQYLVCERYGDRPYTLYRAFDRMADCRLGLYKLDGTSGEFFRTEEYRKLEVAIGFYKGAVKLLDKHNVRPQVSLRLRENARSIDRDFFDQIAEQLLDIIGSAAGVKKPSDICWAVQHNAVWGKVFGITTKSDVWKIVQFKLRRLLYDEIVELEEMPNFQSASILGYCLNVMGVKEPQKGQYGGYGKEWYPLEKAVTRWAKKHFLSFYNSHPHIAEECFPGGITFDQAGGYLVKTYAKGLKPEGEKEHLKLDE